MKIEVTPQVDLEERSKKEQNNDNVLFMSLKEQEQKIIDLEKKNQALRERIAELERSLGIDSQNSSKPTSSDGLKKKNTDRTRSLRRKS